MPLTSEIVHDYKRGNTKLVTSLPESMTDSVYLMNHCEIQKKNVEIFNTQDKELLFVLEKLREDDDSLNLRNVSIRKRPIEKDRKREGVETTKQNAADINLSSDLV